LIFPYNDAVSLMKLAIALIALIFPAICQQPSTPPTEHKRIAQTEIPGHRFELKTLSGATLFAPQKVNKNKRVPLIVHFHGPAWLVEYNIAKALPRAVVITVQLGTGSSVYNRPFDKTETFRAMLDEARTTLGLKHEWSSVNLTAWSAGYGAVRAILRDEADRARVHGVLLLDGIHASYSPEGRPLADGGTVNAADLDSFLESARFAIAGKKTFVITHSQIFPAAYASTTECTDFLLDTLHLEREMAPRNGPMSMHQLTAVDAGNFHVRGYTGDTAPDHIDHIHAMSEWLRLLKVR
jgi:hypothetical protein